MKVISVTNAGLREDLVAWRVSSEYVDAFFSKCTCDGERVTLRPFFFNDTVHLENPRHWLAANAAFWCRAYREAETAYAQAETLASIRAVFYLAGSLGQGEITAMIQLWWRQTHELHQVPAPNYSAAHFRRPQFH